MSLTKHSLGGNYDVIYKLFWLRESLVSDIAAGDGNIEKLFTVYLHVLQALKTHIRKDLSIKLNKRKLILAAFGKNKSKNE
jgi:hypothetical protein